MPIIITQLFPPFYDGELACKGHIVMTQEDSLPDRRLGYRLIRRFYRNVVGRKIPKYVLRQVWNGRFVTPAMSEEKINQLMQEMAIESHKSFTDSIGKEALAAETGEPVQTVLNQPIGSTS